MKISYNWLKEFVDLKKYPATKLADLLTMNFAEIDGIEKISGDFIFDLKILPDRASDCLSHYGVAREIATLSKLKVHAYRQAGKSLKFKVKESKKEKIGDILEVENEEPTICKRYVSRVIKNVKVGQSPKWLTQRLESLGQKSINNIVDATNYVMLELGQPLHAFDFDKCKSMQVKSEKLKVKSEIKNTKIIIRKAKKGEKIVTLDNQEIELNGNILVIADTKDALAIAGVKGGKKAEIDENTKNIILESANFNAEMIRKASRLTGIRTESSVRFAADLDPNLADKAMERLASLIVDIAMPTGRQAGGEVVGGKVDIYPRPVKEYKLGISLEDANKLLGTELSEKEVLDILNRLNFKVKKASSLKEILELVKKLKGKPYKYGASVSFDAPNTFDCSSFVSYLFLQGGIQIPRMAIDQYFFSDVVGDNDAKAGDLAFANTGILKRKTDYESIEFIKGMKIKEGVDHVGIYLGKGKVMHASEGKGVIVEDIKKSKSFSGKKFRGFRRVKEIERSKIFVVEMPTYRRDIRIKSDIIEEIGRLYGYQNIKSKLPEGILTPPKRNDEIFWENASKNALVSAGFVEIYNYSFIGEKDLRAAIVNSGNVLELQNYASDDRRYLRPNLIFGFLRNIEENFKYVNEARIFEIGNIFVFDAEGKISEKKFIGGVISHKGKKDNIKAEEFYKLKGAVDLLMHKLGILKFQYYQPEWTGRFEFAFLPKNNIIAKNIYHPLRLAEIKIGDEKIGFIGEINPNVVKNYDIDERIAAFEIDFEKLARFANEDFIYRPLSKFPAAERDLAILIPINIRVDDVLNVLENAGGQLLANTDLFDIYEGNNIPEGKKSLAFHLIFQSQEKTLLDKEINEILAKIISVLSEKGWEVRS